MEGCEQSRARERRREDMFGQATSRTVAPKRLNPKQYHEKENSGEEWRTPEVCHFNELMGAFPWGKCIVLCLLITAVHGATTTAMDALEEMHVAFEFEQPVPTRSSYGNVPVIGRFFQLACDVGDVVTVNSGFLVKYAHVLPWVATAPVVAASIPAIGYPMLKIMWIAKAAMVSVSPALPLLR